MDKTLPFAGALYSPVRRGPEDNQLAGVVPASAHQPGDDRSDEHHRWRRRLNHRQRHVSRR